jgi:hypothetical protein
MVRRRQTKKQYGPKDYFRPFYKGTVQGMTSMWSNPAMWSDQMVHKTLKKMGSKPYTARDVRTIIKSYCGIMKDQMKKSWSW